MARSPQPQFPSAFPRAQTWASEGFATIMLGGRVIELLAGRAVEEAIGGPSSTRIAGSRRHSVTPNYVFINEVEPTTSYSHASLVWSPRAKWVDWIGWVGVGCVRTWVC